MSATQSQAQDLLPALSRALADATERASASVVQVFGRKRPASGIVIAPERIVTTSHSIEWEEGVRVRTADGRTLAADIAGHAHGADLVLLRVAGLGGTPLVAGTETARTGQLGLLTGRSWSGTQQARLALVSGVGGPIDTADGTRLDQVISLASSPYPGFSGSAVLDAHGGLLAVATAGLMRGRALAIPWAIAAPLVDAIESHGTIKRGYLGVTSQPVRVPVAQRGSSGAEVGLVVLGLADRSPAAEAGLYVGDVIIRAGG
jgi:S1-C subfamily serine protease